MDECLIVHQLMVVDKAVNFITIIFSLAILYTKATLSMNLFQMACNDASATGGDVR